MMKHTHAMGLVLVAAIAFAAGSTFPVGGAASAAQPEKKAAQPEKKPADTKSAQPDKKGAQPEKKDADKKAPPPMPEVKPGPEHKILESLVGNWEGSVKMLEPTGGVAMESAGKIHREMAMDGLYVIEHVDGAPMAPGGKAFKGMGIVGYNQVEKRYESVWIENMTTNMSMETGKYDAAKKSMTWEGEVLDGMTGKRFHDRSVVDMSNPEKQVFAAYRAGPDGKEYKYFEGTFEKKGK